MAHCPLDRTVIGNDDVVGRHPATDSVPHREKTVDIILVIPLIHADQGFFFSGFKFSRISIAYRHSSSPERLPPGQAPVHPDKALVHRDSEKFCRHFQRENIVEAFPVVVSAFQNLGNIVLHGNCRGHPDLRFAGFPLR